VTDTEFYGSVLAGGVALVAVALLGWVWMDRRQRPSELSEEDRAHFVSQEIRRSVVATAMFLLAVGIYFGSRIETKRDGRPNAWFIAIWLAVFALVIVLLTLALVDWVSTRRYARRQRQTILREGLQILGEELRRRAEPPSDGHA
jgi:hypothetical protein